MLHCDISSYFSIISFLLDCMHTDISLHMYAKQDIKSNEITAFDYSLKIILKFTVSYPSNYDHPFTSHLCKCTSITNISLITFDM